MLPPEVPITILDRMYCFRLKSLRKFRISNELVLFHARDDSVAMYTSWLNVHYWGFQRDEALLLARMMLRTIFEDEGEPSRLREFDWLSSFDLTKYEVEMVALSGITGLGERIDRRYELGDRKILLVGEFRQGSRFLVTDGYQGDTAFGPRVIGLTSRDAALTAKTILTLLDSVEHAIEE